MTIVIVIVALLVVIAIAGLLARRIGGTTEDGRPLGDSPQAHDAINPHDIPLDNPGRPEAEAEAGGEAGVTGGDREGDSRAEGADAPLGGS